jgi:hypothetical protein
VIGTLNLAEIVFDVDNRAEAFVLRASLMNVRFQRSGIYVFELLANHARIAEWELSVIVGV